MALRNYQDLIVWQKAMDLVEGVYRTSRKFPKEEIYSLESQIRRAAVSVPSNIAEGEGRGNPREFAQFLRFAHGSLREVETQTLIARRLCYTEEAETMELLSLAGEVGRLTTGLIRSLNV
jgi:four helix bundle protein